MRTSSVLFLPFGYMFSGLLSDIRTRVVMSAAKAFSHFYYIDVNFTYLIDIRGMRTVGKMKWFVDFNAKLIFNTVTYGE